MCDFPRARTTRARPSFSLFGVFGDLREDKVPGFRRKIRREVHLEEQVGLPVAESDEEAVPRRRVPADKRPDPPLQDPLDPSIRQAAGPPPLEPHQHPVLRPRPGEGVPRDPHDGRLRIGRNHDRPPLAREAQASLDGPAPVRSPTVPRGAVRRALTGEPSLPPPRRLLLPFPLHPVRVQRLQRGLEGAALALLHARLAVPVLHRRARLLERLRSLPEPPFPIRLVAHPRNSPSRRNPFPIIPAAIVFGSVFRMFFKIAATAGFALLFSSAQCVPKWRNWQTRQIQGLVWATTWGFKSPLRHHEKPNGSRRKMTPVFIFEWCRPMGI